MLTAFLLYIVLGAVAGILAGLLGIGGGLVIVPMLVVTFGVQGIQTPYLMQVALATSLASIIFTSTSSMLAHHRRGAVLWPVFKAIAPGILIGAYLGSLLVSVVPSDGLKAVFVIFVYYAAVQMFRNKKPKPTRHLPGFVGMTGAGGVIGAFSSLVGIGGGTLCVPFLVWCNVVVHQAIGTAAAVGLPIALAATLGNITHGLGVAGRPEYCLGFVYIPALVGIVVMSVFTAPLGAKLAHSLPVGKLKRVFACLLVAVATKMLWSLL
ncbi:MAG: sulfite exporter TauE/SafE family protein [Desulfovibrionaceae bacterium]